MSYGSKIREFRKERGLTLTKLAEKASISPSFLSSIERGAKKASINVLNRLSVAVNVPVSYLVEENLPRSQDEGNRIHQIRIARGLTIEELAEISDLPINAITEYEEGNRKLGLADIQKLCDALNVNISYLLSKGKKKYKLSDRLRSIREAQGLTVTALADKAGVSPGLISQIENDLTTPSFETLEAIAGAIGIALSYIWIEKEDLEELLSSLSPGVLDLLSDSTVQAVLRIISDFDSGEVKYLFSYIEFFKRHSNLLR
ncbi:Transcriptional regulator, XRE family [Desulfosporosinus sp. I2]|uniref:helix-turn-helix domain-containing protein n=1 Tax=Desulfosporosinus sp. I2 TaxID=1617025 RepID=UPI0005EED776|nr:helix-turn-helix transcriptional regulator [Desulfosporosinus sp. I2]KJR44970.1 Transcriptional regulator, XRE family [Desulfosporosinus sp. I2]